MKAFALLAALILLYANVFAQRPPFSGYYRTHDEWYLREAAERLPQLYKQGEYDSIRAYITITATATERLYVFATRLLVDLEQNKFDENIIRQEYFLDTLQHYAYQVWLSQATTPAVGNQPGNRLEDMPYEDRLFLFDAVWAKALLQAKQLDSLQVLLCNIIAGKIQDPISAIRQKRSVYPSLDSPFKQRQMLERSGHHPNVAIGIGLFAPQGNAVRLGVHPALNVVIGGRSKCNELNIGISVRFGNTPEDYLLLRNGTLYSRHFYEGAYMGLEYTRYLYHSVHFEAGLTGGAGYDAIDFANDNSDHNNDYLKPLEKGSLNLNAGLRMNFFFSTHRYLGLEGKFNKIHYHNAGGSPIDGNAYTLSLLFGVN